MRKFCMVTMSFIIMISQLSYGETAIEGSETAGEILKAYGIVSGYENGELGLDRTLTRAEACVLMSELYGEKSSALDVPYHAYFTDVAENMWYTPYVTYAKERGWISGYPEGDFKPDAAISSKEWASMIMTVLGYPFEWDTVEDDIRAIDIDYTYDAYVPFTRGDAFEILWQALNTPPVDSETDLGTVLGYFEPAEEVIDPPVEDETPIEEDLPEFEVIGYMTPSLRMIKVKFNRMLDPANADFGIMLSDMSGEPVSVNHFELNAAQNELAICLVNPAETYDVYQLNMNNVKLSDGTMIGAVEIPEVDMIDIEGPEIIAIYHLETEQAIEILFSEPVKPLEASDVYINDPSVNVASISMTDTCREAVIVFDEMPDGQSTITFSNTIEDDYGHQLVNQTFTVDLIQTLDKIEDNDNEM